MRRKKAIYCKGFGRFQLIELVSLFFSLFGEEDAGWVLVTMEGRKEGSSAA